MTVNDKIHKLRQAMHSHNIDAYIILSQDPHQSEYVPQHFNSRKWISGFTGSAGVVAFTKDHAGLWTDGRYYLQGETQTADSEMQLHKMDGKPGIQHARYLAEHLPKGSTVAIDFGICSVGLRAQYDSVFSANDITLVGADLITEIWKDRPELPTTEIFEHDTKFGGTSRKDKLDVIRNEMKAVGAQHHFISTLDDVAYVLNLRGSDVAFNPVFVSYLVVSENSATLFINESKVPDDIQSRLSKDNVNILPYDHITSFLMEIPSTEKVLINKGSTTVSIYEAIGGEVVYGKNIPLGMKSVKNDTELGHARKVMVKDCVALAKTFYWLEQGLKKGDKISEYDLAMKIAEYRSQGAYYIGESFPAIIGWKGNGAIIHYRPMKETASVIDGDGVLLCDSGGQYLDGTTDITRTFAIGEVSKEARRNNTLVLKGMIALSKAKFPAGTTGGQLDTLARQFLWQNGLDYGHGTGHGVGFFMNVHEPPQGFAKPPSVRASTVHRQGMISSNEPGFYKTNEYGIRIENLVITQNDEKYDDFLELETITLYPLDLKIMEETLLTSGEKAWINNYHKHIWNLVAPELEEGEFKDWFERKCRPLN